MTNDPKSDAVRRAKARLDAAGMSPDRPLDALLPRLREPELPRTAVHPRVLEVAPPPIPPEGNVASPPEAAVSPPEGNVASPPEGNEWLLVVWENPGGPPKLHQEIQTLVEATLLAELSRPPSARRGESARRFTGIRLVSFAEIAWDVLPAVRAFGFRPDDRPIPDDTRRVLDDEARRSGRTPCEPVGVWSARIVEPPGALGTKLRDIDRMMSEKLGDETWGATPGGFSHLFVSYVRNVFGESIRPTHEGLDALDLLLVQREEGVIRWLPPLVFQALCDFLPVVAAAEHGARIAWAVSEDLGGGFAHPPLLRVEDDGGGVHIPIGQHVLRWWMMPVFAGETVPTPTEWLADQFGS